MSWLFGKRRHQKDSPVDSVEEASTNSDQCEGFTFVERRPTSMPSTVVESPYPSAGSGLYPYIGQLPTYPTALPSDSSKESSQAEAVHYLNGVPFKLCKRLESRVNNDLEIDSLRISEILSFLERIENQSYQYDFSLEEGVVAEMNSRNSE